MITMCFSSVAVQTLSVAKNLQYRIKVGIQEGNLFITSSLREKDKSICIIRHLLQHRAAFPAFDTFPCRSTHILLGDVPLASAKTGAKCLCWAQHPLVPEYIFLSYISACHNSISWHRKSSLEAQALCGN